MISKEERDKEILRQQYAREKFRDQLIELIKSAMKTSNPITPGDILAELDTIKGLMNFYIFERWTQERSKQKKPDPVEKDIDEFLEGLDKEE